ncbi:MAG: antitoxin component YwqK of YwqJK toxin-antitoxin module, partial [Candidatus Omnitrophota bacterium]
MAQGKIGSLKYLLIIGLVGFFSLLVSFYIVSNQMNQEVQELSNDNFNRQVINNTTKNILKNKSKRVDKITARKRMEPNRQFIESVFFIKGKEVARHKSLNDKIFDFEGDAITGTVEFKSLIKDFYGIETYVNGKRNGPFKEYFAEGQLKREAYYLDDEVITNKDYFIDGKLRMEQN